MSKKKKKSVELTASDAMQFILKILVSAYCCVFFTAMPLFYHNNYYDIGDFKYKMFMYLTVSFLLFAFIVFALYMACLIKEKRLTVSSVKEAFASMTVLDMMVLAFGIASIVSFLLSPERTSEYPAFFLLKGGEDTQVVNLPWEGYSGWNMGLRSQLMFVAIFFLVSRYFMKSWKNDLLRFMLISAFLVFSLGVLNRFHVDPLNIYKDLSEVYISQFLSTLGQGTWYSSFMVVLLPVGMAFFLFNDNKTSVANILLACFVAAGGATFVTQNSDSAYPAFAGIIMVMFAVSFISNDRFLKFLEMMIIMLGAMKVIGLFQIIFPWRLTELDSMSLFVSQSPVTLILLILIIGFYVFLRKKIRAGAFNITDYRKIRNIILACTIACIPLGIIIGLLNTKGLLPGDALKGVEYLTFNDRWGNNRGFTWRNTVEVMKEPLWRSMALTGPGPDCYPTVIYASEVRAASLYSFWNGEVVICAHNEWLNMLFNEGILGFITYTGIFISAFISFAKRADNAVMTAGTAAVTGYFLHNMFCYQQILCTPMIFCIMALCVYSIREQSQSRSEQ